MIPDIMSIDFDNETPRLILYLPHENGSSMIHHALDKPVTPSSDFYLRLNRRQLERLPLKHHFSEATSYIPALGITEWHGAIDGQTVSIAWSWALCDDGYTYVTQPLDITSNVMLVSDKGYDAGPSETACVLHGVLRHLDWQAKISSIVLG
ncbi:MAG: DUF4902 domain-containing protein [Actinobacteria bacterium]|nr:DUF4902 domain-containing protein [Actinomycetota bacterium]